MLVWVAMTLAAASSFTRFARSLLASTLVVAMCLPTTALASPPQPDPAPVYVQPAQPAQPVQPAAQPIRRARGLGLTIGGFSMFGSVYLITALAGVIVIDVGRQPRVGKALLIPVGGPFAGFAALDFGNHDRFLGNFFGGFGMVFSGILQLAGLGMGIAGAAMLGRSRAEARMARLSAAPGGFQLRF